MHVTKWKKLIWKGDVNCMIPTRWHYGDRNTMETVKPWVTAWGQEKISRWSSVVLGGKENSLHDTTVRTSHHYTFIPEAREHTTPRVNPDVHQTLGDRDQSMQDPQSWHTCSSVGTLVAEGVVGMWGGHGHMWKSSVLATQLFLNLKLLWREPYWFTYVLCLIYNIYKLNILYIMII